MTTLRIVGAKPIGEGADQTYGDLYVEDGTIVATPKQPVEQTIDASGTWISPGFIDLHTHVFPAAHGLGIDADEVGIRQGVTTVVDAGSTGVRDLDRFDQIVAQEHETRVLAWLNISSVGLVDGRRELSDLANLDPTATATALRARPGLLVGVKARMSSSVVGENGTTPLERAIAAADGANLPVMIHTGNEPPRMTDCADLLRAGDVISHAFHGKPGGMLDEQGIRPRVRAALDRGIRLDVGHGEASFSFEVFDRARADGVLPNSISTDIHHGNVDGVVGSLALTMSKLLASGLGLEAAVRAVTTAPAAVIGRPELGTLAPGTPADLTLFDLEKTPHTLTDAFGTSRTGSVVIVPRHSIRAGVVHACR